MPDRRLTARAMGIAWYRPQDYPRILDIMVDAEKLPRTYGQWYEQAKRTERDMKAAGHIVVRAVIDPETFPAWCAGEGLQVDAKGRTEFASLVAYRAVKDTH